MFSKEERENIIISHLSYIEYCVNIYAYNLDDFQKEDLISICTVTLINTVDSYYDKVGCNLTSYIHVCLKNKIFDYLRKINRLKRKSNLEYVEISFFDVDDEASFPEFSRDNDSILDCYDDKDLIKNLYECFDELDNDCRMALKLNYGFCDGREYTVKEIAENMRITYGQARHLVEKGRIKLRKLLGNYGFFNANTTDIRQYCKKYF